MKTLYVVGYVGVAVVTVAAIVWWLASQDKLAHVRGKGTNSTAHPKHKYVKNVPSRTHLAPGPGANPASNLQWNPSWQLPQPDKGAFVFSLQRDVETMVAFGRGMSDVSPGYVLTIGKNAMHVAPLDNIDKPQQTFEHSRNRVHGTYWVDLTDLTFNVGVGESPEEPGTLLTSFKVPRQVNHNPWGGHVQASKLHTRPMDKVKYFGFGVSPHSGAQTMQTVDGIRIVSFNQNE